MKIIRNSEFRGIVGILLLVLVLVTVMAAASGKFEQWFHITWFSGPRALDKIIFVSDRSGSDEVYVMNTDGSSRKQITKNARVLYTPAVNPLGNRIAYVGAFGKTNQVFSVNAEGGSLSQLTSATGPKSRPGYSPDGTRLSFIASGNVYVADLEGNNPDRVMPTHEEMHAAMASRDKLPSYRMYAWGPDGKGMAGVTSDETGDILVVLPTLEGEALRIPLSVGGRASVVGLAWAARKPILAISVMIGGKSMLVIFDSREKRLMPVAVVERQEIGKPSLSPDGSEVVAAVISRDKKVPSGIVKIDVQSGSGQIIARGAFEDATYSPRADSVMAVRLDERSKRNIVTIDPLSGEVTSLTTDGDSFGAIWSPVSER